MVGCPFDGAWAGGRRCVYPVNASNGGKSANGETHTPARSRMARFASMPVRVSVLLHGMERWGEGKAGSARGRQTPAALCMERFVGHRRSRRPVHWEGSRTPTSNRWNGTRHAASPRGIRIDENVSCQLPGKLRTSIHTLMMCANDQYAIRMDFIEDHMRPNLHRMKATIDIVPVSAHLGKRANAFKGIVDAHKVDSSLIFTPYTFGNSCDVPDVTRRVRCEVNIMA